MGLQNPPKRVTVVFLVYGLPSSLASQLFPIVTILSPIVCIIQASVFQSVFVSLLYLSVSEYWLL